MEVQETDKKPKKKKGRNLLIAFVILILLGAAGSSYWYFFIRGIVSTDDARFNGNMVDLAPQINGTITAVYVHEGDSVKKGQIIFSLNKKSFEADLTKAQAALAQAEAALKIARTQHEKALHGARPEEIEIMEVTRDRLAMEANFAKVAYTRAKTLFRKKLASKESLEQAESAWERAKYAYREADGRLRLLKAGARQDDLKLAEENITLARRQKELAEVSVHQARIALELTSVYSPFDGFAVHCWQNPGDVTTVGRTVVTLFDPSTLHIDANIEEKYLTRVKIGDRVSITVDAYPQLSITGKVGTILPVANSQFSLIPSEGVSGAYIKVSQRIPIRVELDRLPELAIGPGLSVEIKIYHGVPGSGSFPLVENVKF